MCDLHRQESSSIAAAAVLALTIGVWVLSSVGATSEEPAARFERRRAEGWFWYGAVLPVDDQLDFEIQINSALPPALSAAWFRRELDRLKDRALDEPTPENLRAFLYAQRVMLDKASTFAEMFQQVVASDPFLDANVERPLASFAAQESDRAARAAEVELLTQLAGQVGILFFFRSDCPYCAQEIPVLKALEQRYGFDVLAVSLDGASFPSDPFPRFRVDRGQAAALGVQATPALFVMAPPNDIRPLAQGAVGIETIEQRLLLQARLAGWISEEAYARTKPVARRVASVTTGTVGSIDASDPRALVDAIRQRYGLGALR